MATRRVPAARLVPAASPSPQTAAQLFVRCLENEGVEFVFGIPGEETLDTSEALEASSQIEFIPVRHEQGAAFMADAYGRLTGKAGVCMATLGPGATNLATGIADANLDHAPMVALTGQIELSGMHKETHQFIDVVDMFKPMTKWNARVHDSRIIAEAVRKAFSVAATEKPGATHLELPADIMARPTEGQPLQRPPVAVMEPDQGALQRAAQLLQSSQRAVILAGNGVVRQGAALALRDFCRHTGLRVITTFMGKGVVDADDEKLPVHRRAARPELPAGHHGACRSHRLRRLRRGGVGPDGVEPGRQAEDPLHRHGTTRHRRPLRAGGRADRQHQPHPQPARLHALEQAAGKLQRAAVPSRVRRGPARGRR